MTNDPPGWTTTGQRALDEAIARTTQSPDSGIAMCHRQGKTAVYLSDDGKWIVEHTPHGRVTRTPRIAKTAHRS